MSNTIHCNGADLLVGEASVRHDITTLGIVEIPTVINYNF